MMKIIRNTGIGACLHFGKISLGGKLAHKAMNDGCLFNGCVSNLADLGEKETAGKTENNNHRGFRGNRCDFFVIDEYAAPKNNISEITGDPCFCYGCMTQRAACLFKNPGRKK